MRRTMMVAVLCLAVSGCATMVNRGKVQSGPVPGGTARLELRNPGRLTAVYEGNTRLSIGADSLCFDLTRTSTCSDVALYPFVVLPRSGSHTLRLVRDGREATVTVNANTHWAWLFANWVWLAAAPVGWVVDGVSGRMKYFGPLDVERVFRDASMGTR